MTRTPSSGSARPGLRERLRRVVEAVERDDQPLLEAVLELSRSRRLFAPLALCVGALAMMLEGVRVLLSNWRLTLVQVLPAMWIWLAMYDLKAHLLRGKSFHVLHGPILIPIFGVIIAITTGSFFLNAVFAFAIAGTPPPKVRSGLMSARSRPRPVLVSGAIVGLLLAFSTTVVTRSAGPWFALSLSAVIAVMMVCYVAVPAHLIGIRSARSRGDRFAASALAGLLGVAVCTPPYVLARLGILMLGSRVLFVPGLLLLTLGSALQAGATGAVRAIKLSGALIAGRTDRA